MNLAEKRELKGIAGNLPKQQGVNHFRRIKKAYKAGGAVAVTEYVNPYLIIRKNQLNERTKAS